MREDELRAKFAGISVFEKNGYRAPHKPLLILLAIVRAIRNQPRLAYYIDLDEPLAALLRDFGRPTATVHPEYPFWWLQTDQVWQVESDGPMEPRKGHKDPKRSELLSKHARGGFSQEIYDYLSANPRSAADIAKYLLERNFPNSLWDDILSSAGIPANDNVITGSRRGSAFRRLVLEAYHFECCICGLKLQIGTAAFGVEAAHIKWHQAGGPEVVPNGLTLCLIHHKAFDRGAITLTDDCRVLVSKALLSAADVNCTDLADEICTLLQAGGSVTVPGAADVREGATSAVTSLPGAGPKQGGDRPGAGRRAANGLPLGGHWATRPRAG